MPSILENIVFIVIFIIFGLFTVWFFNEGVDFFFYKKWEKKCPKCNHLGKKHGDTSGCFSYVEDQDREVTMHRDGFARIKSEKLFCPCDLNYESVKLNNKLRGEKI